MILPIGQGETVAESPIGAQFDDAATDGDFRSRFGRAVENQLRVHIEPEAFPRFDPSEWAGKTGDRRAPAARNGKLGRRSRIEFLLKLAADKFGDFQGAHPDPPQGTHRDKLAQAPVLSPVPAPGA